MDDGAFVNRGDPGLSARVWAPLQAEKDLLPLRGEARPALYASTHAEHGASNTGAPPLLLVHSVNATASAIEMLPVFERQARRRPVVALELPGFGAADKPDVRYSPRMMQDAIAAAIDWIGAHVSSAPIDVMALSLSCEFAAEVVLHQPQAVRTLALVSPTGMEQQRLDERYESGRTRGADAVRVLLRRAAVGRALYSVVTTRPSMRWFLSRTWGTSKFDPRLLEHGRRCAQAPGARHAPLDFVAGALFTRGIIERYRRLSVPIWVAHGRHGSFDDFGACPERTGDALSLASHRVVRTVFDTGAMPHFQQADAFDAAYEKFLAGAAERDDASLRPFNTPSAFHSREPVVAQGQTRYRALKNDAPKRAPAR
jgi:pimeloyl-ACP methyl ester carboxylesterase